MLNKKSFYPWWIFVVCCFISMIGFGLLVNTVGLFFGPISNEFNVGRSSVALMTTLQNAMAAIALLVAGKVMEKVNLRLLLTISFAVIAVSMFSMAHAQSLPHFYIAWSIIGIFQPIAITISIPVLLSKWFNQKLGTVMGISLGLSAFGGMIFNPIIADIIAKTGWRTGFIAESLILAIFLVPMSLSIKAEPNEKYPAYGIKENKKQAEVTGITLKEAIHRPVFYALVLAMILLQFVSGSVQHISGHVTNIGISPVQAATVVSGVMIGAAVGKISIGYLLDKMSSWIVLLIFTIFGVVGWSGLVIFNTSFLLVVSGFVLGLGQGFCLVALPYLIRTQFGNRDYSNILSIINMLGAFAMSLSVYLVGMVFDQTGSYNLGWMMNVGAYVVSFAAIFVTLKNVNQEKESLVEA